MQSLTFGKAVIRYSVGFPQPLLIERQASRPHNGSHVFCPFSQASLASTASLD